MSQTIARKRTGSRAAKRISRSKPLPKEDRPVQAGHSGGRFKPLGGEDVLQIHQSVLEVLSTIGMSQATPSCIELVCAAGGTLTEQGRLLFPPELIETTLSTCAQDVTLYGQNPEYDVHLSGSKLHFSTAGAAVSVVNPIDNSYRESTLKDLYNIARLVDTLEHIHMFQRPMVACDMTNPRDLDINTCYASLSGTSKHVGTSWVLPEHVEESLKMLHDIAGSEKAWRDRPFVSMSCCFAVPPLRFAEDSCDCLEVAVLGGMPILLLAAGQAGATTPASLAGSVVQSVAEVLAGLTFVNLLKPGHPAIFGTWPFISDLRTGSMSGGSGEQGILMAAVAQMGRYYGLPTGVAAGMSDAKVPDAQSGYEKGYTNTLAAHSGANIVYESAGMHGSLLGCCYESFVIDNDMLGAINRTVRGIEVNQSTLSLDVMRDVCIDGPNHYLGHTQTLELMQREYLYPAVADRNSPKEWLERGQPILINTAKATVDRVLSTHYPEHISMQKHADLKDHFDLRLDVNELKTTHDQDLD